MAEISSEIKYRRKDVEGGYIYGKTDINYYRQLQSIDILDNKMIGDYNLVGSYIVNRKIIEELIQINKFYTETFANTLFCESENNIGEYGKLKFAVKIFANYPKQNFSTAVLQLLEPINRADGYFQNTNSVDIDTFSEEDTDEFVKRALKKFNVDINVGDGKVLKEKTDKVEEILERKNYLNELNKMLFNDILKLNKELYIKRIKILSKSVLGKKILKKLTEEAYQIEGWFINEDNPAYYKSCNQILDRLLEVYNEKISEDIKLKIQLNKAEDDFSSKCYNMCENAKRVLQKANAEVIKQAEVQKTIAQDKQQKVELVVTKQIEAPTFEGEKRLAETLNKSKIKVDKQPAVKKEEKPKPKTVTVKVEPKKPVLDSKAMSTLDAFASEVEKEEKKKKEEVVKGFNGEAETENEEYGQNL